MDIEELVSGIKKTGGIVREPVRVRRKPKEGRRGNRRWADSPEGKASLREADRKYWRSVSGRWRQLKKEYERRGQEWNISLSQWKWLWEEAGVAQVGEKRMLIFLLRGRGKEDARLYRINQEDGWNIGNVVVLYKGQVRANGRKWKGGDI